VLCRSIQKSHSCLSCSGFSAGKATDGDVKRGVQPQQTGTVEGRNAPTAPGTHTCAQPLALPGSASPDGPQSLSQEPEARC
jgi:hypothetical protein